MPVRALIICLVTLSACDAYAQCRTFVPTPVIRLNHIQVAQLGGEDFCTPYARVIADLTQAYYDHRYEDFPGIYRKAIGRRDHLTPDELTITYVYARLLELTDEREAVEYYQYVHRHSPEGEQLNQLAKISALGISGSVASITEAGEDVDRWIKSPDISADRKAELALVHRRYLSSNEQTEFTYACRAFVGDVKGRLLKTELLAQIAHSAMFQEKPTANNDTDLALSYIEATGSNLFVGIATGLGVSLKVRREKYTEAHAYTAGQLKAHFGLDTLNASVIDSLARSPMSNSEAHLLRVYARASLYLMYVGQPVKPAETAFNVFKGSVRRKIEGELARFGGNSSMSKVVSNHSYKNQFIIGNYLYGETNDVTYLSESMSLFDVTMSMDLYNSAQLNAYLSANDLSYIPTPEDTPVDSAGRSERGIQEILRGNGERAARLKREGDFLNGNRGLAERIKRGFTVDLAALQAAYRGTEEAVVCFYEGNVSLYRLFVSGDTVAVTDISFRVEEQRKVNGDIDTLNQIVQDPAQRGRLAAKSHDLYQFLFADIDSLLPANLHIITHGSLGLLPFNLLRKDSLSERPRYFGIDHAISRQFSVRTMQLFNERELRPLHDNVLAFAPRFTGEAGNLRAVRQGQVNFSPLSHNTTELEHLEALSGGRYHYGEAATLANYERYAPEYAVIHLATHAISNDRDGLDSRVYLLDERGQPAALSAREIKRRPLTAKLVSLSACETGRGGQNRIEGTVGLTRAYLAAGARTVVASNWSIEDRATSEVMATFYDRVTEGATPHVAMRDARRDYLSRYPDAHPSRWAAFDVYGGTRPIYWDRTKAWYTSISVLAWSVLGATVALLAAMFLYRRPRKSAA